MRKAVAHLGGGLFASPEVNEQYLFGTLSPRQSWISWWIGSTGRSWAFSAISLPLWAIWAWNFLNWNGSAPSFSFSRALRGHCLPSAWWSAPLNAASNSAGLTGYGRSIGEVGQDIITELNEIQSLSDVVNSSHFGLGIITSPIMLLFCVILMGYAVLTVRYKISRGRYGRWRSTPATCGRR